MMNDDAYFLLDSGCGRKLERFGAYVLDRPCAQAVWQPSLPQSSWKAADACFVRREQEARWIFQRRLPQEWQCSLNGVRFVVTPTDFGHMGIFPEHAYGWEWMTRTLQESGRKNPAVLNLFAYTGGATMALAKAGACVCHLDASKKTVEWARRNAEVNGLGDAPIRWIIDDVTKFLQREQRRGRKYDGIVLDPPSFGRGTNQELFKIDSALPELLQSCFSLLTEHPLFLFLTCHTPGYTPIVLENLLRQMAGGRIASGEMKIPCGYPLPSGSYAVWQP